MKSKNPYYDAARDVYAAMLAQTRAPEFYLNWGVDDDFEGRFEVLCLHGFIVMHVVLNGAPDQAEEFNQAYFDIMFADIDQALRQTGKGDMGVPKHMKRMMKGFNGRMNAFEEAFEDSAAFQNVIGRNVFNDKNIAHVPAVEGYMRDMIAGQDVTEVLNGNVSLVNLANKRAKKNGKK